MVPDRCSVAWAAILTPLFVILLTLGWFHRENSGPLIGHPKDDTYLPEPNTSPVVAGYFVNWAIYDRNYNVIDLAQDSDKLSHVLYAFANLNDDGTIVLGDAWADTDKHFEAAQTIDGHQDTWKEAPDNNLYGNLKQLHLLKKQKRHLKVSLSIGGWSWSANFSTVATNPSKRKQFATSAIEHVANLGLDGIDIDWEFPKDAKEAKGYIELLSAVRQALDTYQLETKDTARFLLSVAMPCGPDNYNILELGGMEPFVDLFYLMAYDFSGDWDKTTGHQSALFDAPLNVDQAVHHFISAGVPSHKLVLGLPVYGRGFLGTKGPGSSFTGLPKGTWDRGAYDYKDLPPPGSTEHFDEKKIASWSFNPTSKEYVTYDTPQVIERKCEYIQTKGLGGAMFWELSADYHGDHPRSLLNTVHRNLGAPNQEPNHIEFPQSRYENIN
ncbi:chitinase [Phycomyces nitens]|nr:chitinase [Phycomyces nitens]